MTAELESERRPGDPDATIYKRKPKEKRVKKKRVKMADLLALVDECAKAHTVDQAWAASERCYDYLVEVGLRS